MLFRMEENNIALHMIAALAKEFPQLYLAPGEEGARQYPEVVRRGRLPERRELAHFHGSPADDCRTVDTPAGAVRAVTLGDRRDFETFLQIMGRRCVPEEIPPTQGAEIIEGIVNRGKIERHREAFYRAAQAAGQPEPGILEWLEEHQRFTADKANYTEALIVLSVGPYSAVPAEQAAECLGAALTGEAWLDLSHTIRLYHECGHFVCRRRFHGEADAVADELAADAVGIFAAIGRYDRPLAERFLGIRGGKYAGGRLENYTDDPAGLLPAIDAMLTALEETAKKDADLPPLELAIRFREAVQNR